MIKIKIKYFFNKYNLKKISKKSAKADIEYIKMDNHVIETQI